MPIEAQECCTVIAAYLYDVHLDGPALGVTLRF
jgi:hypothetical protein